MLPAPARLILPVALAVASLGAFGASTVFNAGPAMVGCEPITNGIVSTPDGAVAVPDGLANPAPACETPARQSASRARMAALLPLGQLVRPIGAPTSAPMVRVQVASAPRLLRVPLVRTLRPGSHGTDVRELQRALIRARLRPVKLGAPGNYGVWTRREIANVQRRHRIRPAAGWYGPRTHAVLAASYDARSVMVLRNAFVAEQAREAKVAAAKEAAARIKRAADARAASIAKIVAYTRWAETNAFRIHYSQGSLRGTYERRPYTLDQWLDCSMYVTDAYAAAGLADPNGFGYNGYGYTGTLIVHGTRVFGEPQAGDLVFYGSPISHVAIATGGGYVSSHGSEPGPLHVRFDYRPVVSIHRYLPMQ